MIGLSVYPVWSEKSTVAGRFYPRLDTRALEYIAKTTLVEFGCDLSRLGNWERGFDYQSNQVHLLSGESLVDDDLDLRSTGQLPELQFWYRRSRQSLAPVLGLRYVTTSADPPISLPGMVTIWLDPEDGRLLRFQANPESAHDVAAEVGQRATGGLPDWRTVARLAGLDEEYAELTIKPGPSKCAPPIVADYWLESRRSGAPGRVSWEAAWDQSRLVYFQRFGSKPPRSESSTTFVRPIWFFDESMNPSARAARYVLALVLVVGFLVLARHNLRLGHGDRKGAFRLGVYSFAVSMVGWLFGASHVPDLDRELASLWIATILSVTVAAWIWLGYIALEPQVRRYWPQALCSWSRLLSGHIRDPLVGRELLCGCVAGVFLGWLTALATAVASWYKSSDELTQLASLSALIDLRYRAGLLLQINPFSIQDGLCLVVMLLWLRFLVRRLWLAGACLSLIVGAIVGEMGDSGIMAVVGGLVCVALITLAVRCGLLVSIAAMFTWHTLLMSPIAGDVLHGPGIDSVLTLAAIGASGAFGFWTSTMTPARGKALTVGGSP